MVNRKKIYLLLFFISEYAIMQAQATPSTTVGEYYSRGVLETACHFKLHEDRKKDAHPLVLKPVFCK